MDAILTNLKDWLAAYGKVSFLILAMAAGALVPQASRLSFLIQYMLMGMLFLSFLGVRFNPRAVGGGVLKVLAANLLIGFASYLLLARADHELAMSAFITAIAPTAISSTVLVSLIQGKVDFMTGAVLLTNVVVALVVPLAIPLVVGRSVQVSTLDVLLPVLITMFVPLILARLAMYLPEKPLAGLMRARKLSFFFWLTNLFIISAKASDFIRNTNDGSVAMLLKIILMALVICVINFVIGAWLGGKEFHREASQALGQKNNSFAIWVALTFMNPLIAMGPTIYIVYHHLYNTWQIYQFEKKNRENPADGFLNDPA